MGFYGVGCLHVFVYIKLITKLNTNPNLIPKSERKYLHHISGDVSIGRFLGTILSQSIANCTAVLVTRTKLEQDERK